MNLSVFLRALAGTSLVFSLRMGVPVLSTPPSQGATFHVDTAEDAIDAASSDGECQTDAGYCSLRAAVMQANALPGEDTILLPGAFAVSLNRSGAGENGALTGDVDILDDLRIIGEGMSLSGADASGLLDRAIHVHPGVFLGLSGLSLVYADSSGQDGGGLLNQGTVSMVETALQFHHAQNGAGVFNLGHLSLERSVIGYNTADGSGGGIRNEGTLTIDRSTIAENMAFGPGGGIENQGTLIVRNSTLAQNRAGNRAAAVNNGPGASAKINNASINYNQILPDGSGAPSTGGLYNETPGTVEIGNSILALNTIDTQAPQSNCLGTIQSAGYNLFGTDTDCSVVGDLTGNLIGVDPLLPFLPSLDDPEANGTWGYPPLPGSPSIDAGNPAPPGSGGAACESADQRGMSRPQGAACDIGAYEAASTPAPTQTATDTPAPSSTPTPTASSTATATPTATSPPGSPTDQIRAMQAAVRDYAARGDIAPSVAKPMLKKLDSALRSLNKGNLTPAVHQMEAFVRFVNAQDGKKIPSAVAEDLLTQANAVIAQLSSAQAAVQPLHPERGRAPAG